MGRIKLLSELIKAVGKKNKKTLKNTKPTTIKGVNIKTKAGKKFGEKVKNQPKLIAGQKPKGMRDDLPADIDKPSFFKKGSIDASFRDKNPTKKQAGGALVSLRRRGLDKGRRDMLNTFKEAKKNKPDGRMNLDDIKKVEARKKARLGKASTKALKARGMKDGGGLRDKPEGNKGLPKLPTEVRNKMGFKKDGGLVSATAKLKAQGLTHGGPVRGKARGMGAATKGGGYNV